MTDREIRVLDTKKFVDDTTRETTEFLDKLIFKKFPDNGAYRWLIHGRIVNMMFYRFFKISMDATKDFEEVLKKEQKD